MSYGINSS